MILRYPVGNASAAKMDETALGPWVSVVRKTGRSKKVPLKKQVFFFRSGSRERFCDCCKCIVFEVFEVFPAPWL